MSDNKPEFKMIRDAKVEITQVHTHRATQAIEGMDILVTDDAGESIPVHFGPKTREAMQLASSDVAYMTEQLNGGNFSFLGDDLLDYRPSTYQGFVHSDESIADLIEHAGVTPRSQFARKSVKAQFSSGAGEGAGTRTIGSIVDTFDLNVPTMGQGGQFTNDIAALWSPYSDKISSLLIAERLICNNGMVMDAPFVTYKTPILSDVSENIAVMMNQLKPRLEGVLQSRYEQMSVTPARLDLITSTFDALKSRSNTMALSLEVGATSPEMENMVKLMNVLDPEIHLSGIYHESVFRAPSREQKNVRGHLTEFALYNLITEVTTHYGVDPATDSRLTRITNSLVFDSLEQGKQLTPKTPKVKSIDHDLAFFGDQKPAAPKVDDDPDFSM